ncbi:hypothetical protein GGX14DRAFT_384035 [Mycena pura]|uniref:Uncharacterized protein n=1 Tax=Mycena pura TaxID=153505 RepID=A0AAD7E682_9AGAR|nr:hypothetical protein GGX14DRAFT_384035 [Mycena pura]
MTFGKELHATNHHDILAHCELLGLVGDHAVPLLLQIEHRIDTYLETYGPPIQRAFPQNHEGHDLGPLLRYRGVKHPDYFGTPYQRCSRCRTIFLREAPSPTRLDNTPDLHLILNVRQELFSLFPVSASSTLPIARYRLALGTTNHTSVVHSRARSKDHDIAGHIDIDMPVRIIVWIDPDTPVFTTLYARILPRDVSQFWALRVDDFAAKLQAIGFDTSGSGQFYWQPRDQWMQTRWSTFEFYVKRPDQFFHVAKTGVKVDLEDFFSRSSLFSLTMPNQFFDSTFHNFGGHNSHIAIAFYLRNSFFDHSPDKVVDTATSEILDKMFNS